MTAENCIARDNRKRRGWTRGTFAASLMLVAIGFPSAICAAQPAAAALVSPWDQHAVKAKPGEYSCPAVAALPQDIVAYDYYSDAQHSVKDEKRYEAYNAAAAQYTHLSSVTARAADKFQETGNTGAAACVMQLLLTQAQAGAMTGHMSSNQANYVQNWTLGALAIAFLKVRAAGPDALGVKPEQMQTVEQWLKTAGDQVEAYFAPRHAKGTSDGRNNHLYWAGFAAMAAGIAANDRGLYDWGESTYKYGVDQIADDGTLPLEMARGQRALHYHLFALAPLVTMAELGTVNGDDLYAYNHARLRLLIARSLSGLLDNHYFATKAGALQDTPEKGRITSSDVVWLTPYLRRYPDAGASELLSKVPLEPYGYIGGMPPP